MNVSPQLRQFCWTSGVKHSKRRWTQPLLLCGNGHVFGKKKKGKKQIEDCPEGLCQIARKYDQIFFHVLTFLLFPANRKISRNSREIYVKLLHLFYRTKVMEMGPWVQR
jgi:hypothetical protein